MIEHRAENLDESLQEVLDKKPILRIPYDLKGGNSNSALVNWPRITFPAQMLIKHGDLWKQTTLN